MARETAAEIYMMKKCAGGVVVAFRLGARHGLEPGMQLSVLNEDGIPVGRVQVLASGEDESEGRVAGGGAVKLGCRVILPGPVSS